LTVVLSGDIAIPSDRFSPTFFVRSPLSKEKAAALPAGAVWIQTDFFDVFVYLIRTWVSSPTTTI
jgi:hypothetical protein